jgi:hypothetical protein
MATDGNHNVNRRANVLGNGCSRPLPAVLQHQRLKSQQCIVGRVGVAGGK